jgi:hypothetical protein
MKFVARGFVIVAILLILCPSALAWDPISYWIPANTWDELFILQPNTVYTYDLRAYHGSLRYQGVLNISVSKYQEEIEFRYDLNGLSVSGSSLNNPQALIGALTLSYLSASGSDMDILRLLLSPLQFINWTDQFSECSFRIGTVWRLNYNPPVTFEVNRQNIGGTGRRYEGTITSGRSRIMDLTIDLFQPLPVNVRVYGTGNWQYVAELRPTSSGPVLVR